MTKLWAIIRKDTLVRFASPVEWIFFLVLPLLFTLVLGAATGAYAEDRLPLTVMDFSPAGASAHFLDALRAREQLRLIEVAPQGNYEQLSLGEAEALLALSPNFSAGGGEMQLLLAPNSLNSMAISQEIQAVLAALNAQAAAVDLAVRQAQERGLPPEALEAFRSQAQAMAAERLSQPALRVDYITGGQTSEVRFDPRANSAAGQMITWVSVSLLGISQVLAFERQQGTLSRFLSTPTRRAVYLGGTLLGQVLTALVQMSILLAVSGLLMRINWGADLLALGLLLLAFSLAMAALGTLLGTLVRSEAQAGSLSVIFGMLFGLLGGCWFPREIFPAAVRQASLALPSTWAMQGMLDLTLSGGKLPQASLEILVLLGFAALFFTLAIWRFRKLN